MPRRPHWTAVAGAIIGLMAFCSALGSYQKLQDELRWHAAENQKLRAKQTALQADLLYQKGRAEADAGRRNTALLWWAKALHDQPDDAGLRLASRYCPFPLQTVIDAGSPATCLDFSPDGQSMIVGTESGTARVWKCTGAPASQVMRHSKAIKQVAFSPRGDRLLTLSYDGTVGIWDLQGRPVTPPILHGGELRDGDYQGYALARFSPDGKYFLIASNGPPARIYSADSGRPVSAPIPHRSAILSAAFSFDGRYAATASGRDGVARVWEVPTGKPVSPVLKCASPPIRVSFSSDGRKLVTGSLTGVQVWDALTGRSLASPKFSDDVYGATCQNDIVIGWGNHGVYAWMIKWERPVEPEYFKQFLFPWDRRFHPSKPWMVDTDPSGESIQVRNYLTNRTVSPPLPALGRVSSAMLSPDGTYLGIASDDGAVRVFRASLDTGEFTLGKDRAFHAALSPDGSIAAAASYYGVRAWDTRTLKPLPWVLHHTNVDGLAFSPDGKVVLTGSGDGSIRRWDSQTGKNLSALPGTGTSDDLVEFSPDGRWMVTASGNEAVSVYDTVQGRTLQIQLEPSRFGFVELGPVTFSPDSRYLLVPLGPESLQVWDVVGRRALSPILKTPSRTRSAAFSPDGQRLATAGDDGLVLWDSIAGKQLFSQRSVVSVSIDRFTDDGRQIVVSQGDIVRFLDATDGHPTGPSMQLGGASQGSVLSPNHVWIATSGAIVWDMHGRPVTPPLYASHLIGFTPDGRGLLTLADSAQLWDLGTDADLPIDLASLQAEIRTGLHLDESGAAVPLTAAEWQSRFETWKKLAAEHASRCRYPRWNTWLQRGEP